MVSSLRQECCPGILSYTTGWNKAVQFCDTEAWVPRRQSFKFSLLTFRRYQQSRGCNTCLQPCRSLGQPCVCTSCVCFLTPPPQVICCSHSPWEPLLYHKPQYEELRSGVCRYGQFSSLNHYPVTIKCQAPCQISQTCAQKHWHPPSISNGRSLPCLKIYTSYKCTPISV